MSIVIPAGQTRTGIPLSGARTSRTTAQLKRTRPVAIGAVLSYTAVNATTAATAFATQTWTEEAQTHAAHLWRASLGAIVAAAVLTAAWTQRIAGNASRRGVPNVRTGAMTLAWFVPLVGPPAAMRGIGRLLRELDYSERRLAFWLFGLYAHLVATIAASVVVLVATYAPDGAPRADAILHQAHVLWLQAVLGAIVTVLAARAVLHADRALSTVGRVDIA